MGRTIGTKWPKSAPRGDGAEYCAICGVKWRFSQLRRDGCGRLVCPDEGDGLDEKTLNRINAEMGRRVRPVRPLK
jgi:hypothetical protein